LIEIIIYGIAVGIVIGVVIVEYSWFRYSRRVRRLVREVMRELENDGELKERVRSFVDELISYAFESVRRRLNPDDVRGLMLLSGGGSVGSPEDRLREEGR